MFLIICTFIPESDRPASTESGVWDIQFSGLTPDNRNFNGTHDCTAVSGFSGEEEARRYFKAATGGRNSLEFSKHTDCTAFIITGANLGILLEKQRQRLVWHF